MTKYPKDPIVSNWVDFIKKLKHKLFFEIRRALKAYFNDISNPLVGCCQGSLRDCESCLQVWPESSFFYCEALSWFSQGQRIVSPDMNSQIFIVFKE